MPPVIPPSLQPTTMTPGAVTVAQQKDIKQYGSLQAASTSRAETNAGQIIKDNISQKEIINSRINELNAVVNQWKQKRGVGYSKNFKRQSYYNVRSAEAEIAELNKLKSGIQEGGAYKSIVPVINQVKSYGDNVRTHYRQKWYKKESSMSNLEQRRDAIQQAKVEQKIIIPNTRSVNQKPVVQPGQSLYVPIENIRDTGGTTIYTSPTREGPSISSKKIKYVSPIRDAEIFSKIPPKFEDPQQTRQFKVQKNIRIFTPLGAPKKEIIYGSTGLAINGRELLFTPVPIEAGMTKTYEEEAMITPVRIKTDYSRSIITRAEELFPAKAGVVMTDVYQEQIYVTSSADYAKIQKLIKSNKFGAARELRIFLREKQRELKEDILKYNDYTVRFNIQEKKYLDYINRINSQEQITKEEENKAKNLEKSTTKLFEEADKLKVKINQGQIGTLEDMTFKASKSAGMSITFGKTVYEGEKIALATHIGMAGFTGLATPGMITTLNTISKPLKYTKHPSFFLAGSARGAQEFVRTKDIERSVVAGAGLTTGLYAGFYSKPIVEGAGKTIHKIDKLITKVIGDPTMNGPRRYYSNIGQQMQTTEVVNAVDEYGNVIQISKAEAIARKLTIIGTRTGALGEFGRSSKTKQIEIIKKAFEAHFKKNIYLDKTSFYEGLKKQIKLAEGFMKDAGLNNKQIKEIINAVFPKQTSTILGGTSTGGQKQVIDTIARTTTGTKITAITAQETFTVIKPRIASDTIAGIYAATRTKQREKTKTVTALAFTAASIASTEAKTKEDTISLFAPRNKSISNQGTLIEQIPFQESIPKRISLPLLNPRPTIPISGESIIGGGTAEERDRGGKPPKKPKIVRFGFPDFDFGTNKRKKNLHSYYGEVKQNSKWVQVTEKPHTKEGAMDKVARIIDNTLSAQGRVLKVGPQAKTYKKGKRPPQVKLETGDGYYEKNKKKFRGFKMFKGKRMKLNNQIIEKKQYRTDTLGETNKLTVSQSLARIRKRRAGLPVRRKKSMFRL